MFPHCGDGIRACQGDGVFKAMSLTHHTQPMTKFNQALIAAASTIALFGGALTLITPAAKSINSHTINSSISAVNGYDISNQVQFESESAKQIIATLRRDEAGN